MLRIINLHKMDFEESLQLQKKIQTQRIQNLCDDTLLLLEHEPILTKGIRTDENNILASKETLQKHGIKVYETSRGGDVTYLGPGQVIGYIIMNIDSKGRGIRSVVKKLEQVTTNILKNEFNIESHTEDKKYTGVFVGKNKLTALGIAVNHRVTMHGFAMNVNTDLNHFNWIIPCGLKDRGVTSIEKLIGKPYDIEQMKHHIRREFETLFDIPSYEVSKEDLYISLEDRIREA